MKRGKLRLGVVTREDVPRIAEARVPLEAFLRAHPDIELIDVCTTDRVSGKLSRVDLLVVLGGDGTILRTCRQLGAKQVPILGVNFGRLGFLADLMPDEFQEAIPRIVAREYSVVDHLMFTCRLIRKNGKSVRELGLNEVAILTGGSLGMISIDLAIDGEHVATYNSDGLIVSTPVGSTAHSLAAGGPILRQDLQAFVITPICPHTLTNRPLVDSANCVFVLSSQAFAPGAMLVIDGQSRYALEPNDRIEIRRAPFAFRLARLPSHSFYSTLHRKLGWASEPQRRQP